jgi:hypothetical protein
MRKLIVLEHISLDGVIQAPGGPDEDPLMQKIRYLDKLIDELAKGKALEKILRQE